LLVTANFLFLPLLIRAQQEWIEFTSSRPGPPVVTIDSMTFENNNIYPAPGLVEDSQIKIIEEK